MAVLALRRDDRWLSLTPEPERLLPEARAALRSGRTPPPEGLVRSERAAAAELVVGARRARWEAWLRDSAALADQAAGPTEAAGALVRDVVANHDALALGLPGADPKERHSPRPSPPRRTRTSSSSGRAVSSTSSSSPGRLPPSWRAAGCRPPTSRRCAPPRLRQD
jgi:hypothetical protein